MKPHPWFNPPIRRHLTTAFCVVWLLVEFASAGTASLWVLIAAAAVAWCAWDFYLAGHYPVIEPRDGKP